MRLDRRFLDFEFIFAQGTFYYDNASSYTAPTGTIYFDSNANSGKGNLYKYNGSQWEEISPVAINQEVFILSTGDIYRYNGSSWNLLGTINSYIVVNDILEDKVGESQSNENHFDGDKYLKTTDDKIYTYSDSTNEWVAGNFATNGKYFSKYDFYIYIKDGKTYTHTSVANGTIILNQADLALYAYNSSLGLVKVNSDEKFITERHTLTNDEVSSKSFKLSKRIKPGTETQNLIFLNGILQDYYVDYEFEEYTQYKYEVTWAGKTLANELKAGDKFVVKYIMG